MPEFNWSCVIPTRSSQSIEVRVRGYVQLRNARAEPTLQARGLFGPTTVSYKIIPEDGAGFIPVNIYTTFARINRDVRVYERHLSDVIDKNRQTSGGQTTFDITSAYKKIKNNVLPVAWALYTINLGNNVWLENESGDKVPMEAAPSTPSPITPILAPQRAIVPRVTASREATQLPTVSRASNRILSTPRPSIVRSPTPSQNPPPIPPRLSSLRPQPIATPSAPPQEFLYPELPGQALYPEPPSYADVMGEPDRSALLTDFETNHERIKKCTIL